MMICFKDKTFCSSPTCRNECGRKFTERDRIEAEEWWGGNDPPIAFSPFCDEDGNRSKWPNPFARGKLWNA